MSTTAESASVTPEDFRAYRETGDRRVRNRIVEAHLGVADFYARRYAGRGVAEEDLRQLALLSMVRAVDRFDPDRGIEFTTFASRTVEGEIKRHFRDRSWSVRPPRRVQELHLQVRRADEELTARLGRPPRVEEVAAEVGESVDHVLEAIEAGTGQRAASLDQPLTSEHGSATRGELVADHEDGYEHVHRRMLVSELVQRLPERERQIVVMRFFDGMSQPEIAERVGVSQSYLSRLLRKILLELREQMDGEEPAAV